MSNSMEKDSKKLTDFHVGHAKNPKTKPSFLFLCLDATTTYEPKELHPRSLTVRP